MGIFNAPMGLGMKGAGGGIGRALTGPQIPVQSAPVDPSQISKWQAFRQKLASDPNLRMALLTAGVNMMRTPEMGQTGFDVFADAAGTGIGTLDQLRQRDKGERNEASDRQFTRESTGRQLDQGDRRVAAAETGVAQRGTQLAQQQSQFEATLAEQQRQFDERIEAGAFYGMGGGAAASTGPERMASIAAESFIKSGIYPDTEQGRALADLRSKGLIGKDLTNPRDRLEYSAEFAKDLMLLDSSLTKDQAIAKASAFVDTLARNADAGDPATYQQADPYEGTTIPHSTQGTGKVQSTGRKNDKGEALYVIVFPGGTTSELTQLEIEGMKQDVRSQ